MSNLAISAPLPHLAVMEIASSIEEYVTLASLSGIKSFTLISSGYEKSVIMCQSLGVCLGSKPKWLMCKSGIGSQEKGPAREPRFSSFMM